MLTAPLVVVVSTAVGQRQIDYGTAGPCRATGVCQQFPVRGLCYPPSPWSECSAKAEAFNDPDLREFPCS